MAQCKYLDGENRAPRSSGEARALVGHKVRYLRPIDIDRSGRGYVFPRTANVVDVRRGQLIFDGHDSVTYRNIIELVDEGPVA